MAGTRLDIQTMVYDRVGVSTADAQTTPAVVNRFINDALHELEVEHDWPWLQTQQTISTANGFDTYALASNWRRTIQFRIADSDSLTERGIIDLQDGWADTARGQPQEYAIFGDQVVFRATPDGVYSIVHRYTRKESDLSADGSTPLVPVEYHPAVAEKATLFALRRLRDEGRAAGAAAAYDGWLKKMRDDIRRSKTAARVRVRPGGFIG